MQLRSLLIGTMLAGGVTLLAMQPAAAHCDSIDGPVAKAAIGALDGGNVNAVLPYVKAEAEVELAAAFALARGAREKGGEARTLADRYFIETAVRLHRAGEGAPYTGLKPAGTDYGPAIPAAEQALASGSLAPAQTVIGREIDHGLQARFEHARHAAHAAPAPKTRADVAAAREQVAAELAFVGYVQGLYLAAKGGAHAE